MSRHLRDKLPCASQTLQAQIPTDARKGLKTATTTEEQGDSVRICRDEAIMTSKHSTPRSFNIMTHD